MGFEAMTKLYPYPTTCFCKSDLCPHSNCNRSLAEIFLYYDSLQITLKNLTNQEVATFTYGEWLSKLKNDNGSLECEMPAVINDNQMMEDTTYTLQVKTSDVGGISMVDIL